jgi:hypothetical protein
MPVWIRVLLSLIVVVVPGGMKLLPVLARDALRRRARELPQLAQART